MATSAKDIISKTEFVNEYDRSGRPQLELQKIAEEVFSAYPEVCCS